MIQGKNFSHQVTPSEIDTEYRGCNFIQAGESDGGGGWLPTRIFPGDDTPRTFIKCNMVNCLPPPGSTLIQCNTQLVEYNRDDADHVHGRLNPVSFDILPQAVESYPRRVHKEVITAIALPGNGDGLATALDARPDVEKVIR